MNVNYNYSVAKNKVYCMTVYAGRTIKGIAKCDPEDEFDLESGKDLARARCEYKLNHKKLKRCQARYAKAAEEYRLAAERLNKAGVYVDEALERLSLSGITLRQIEEKLS